MSPNAMCRSWTRNHKIAVTYLCSNQICDHVIDDVITVCNYCLNTCCDYSGTSDKGHLFIKDTCSIPMLIFWCII